MIFYRTLKYLKYILLSHHSRGHGIHSPFVFNLISKIFRSKINQSLVSKVEQITRKMKSDKRLILVNDPGYKSVKSEIRKVSDIARRSTASPKYGRLLSNMAANFGKPLIIELGTSLGISTLYMALSCKDAKIITIEACKKTAAMARLNFIEAGLNNITVFEGSFDEMLFKLSITNVNPGLIFINGTHQKEAVLKYFNKLSEISDSKTVFIIDDIYYSKEMADAWEELKSNKKVSVSVDIFSMGILFLRDGISHNSYVIRY